MCETKGGGGEGEGEGEGEEEGEEEGERVREMLEVCMGSPCSSVELGFAKEFHGFFLI